MGETVTKRPVMLYTEQTPNPESLKFVTNVMLYKGTADFPEKELAEKWSPLATDLFEFPYVKGVYICNNFVTITKEFAFSWDDLMLNLKQWLKEYIESDKPIVEEGFAAEMEKIEAEQREKMEEQYSGEDAEVVEKVRELIRTYVKPAVEMDGGNIEFKSYDKGVVTVTLEGACSGCPSSTVTLKAGIEGMLKRMLPQITEVVAEMG